MSCRASERRVGDWVVRISMSRRRSFVANNYRSQQLSSAEPSRRRRRRRRVLLMKFVAHCELSSSTLVGRPLCHLIAAATTTAQRRRQIYGRTVGQVTGERVIRRTERRTSAWATVGRRPRSRRVRTGRLLYVCPGSVPITSDQRPCDKWLSPIFLRRPSVGSWTQLTLYRKWKWFLLFIVWFKISVISESIRKIFIEALAATVMLRITRTTHYVSQLH